jgi:hypothetical protein
MAFWAALHKKSGFGAISGSSMLNKPLPLVVDCNLCARPGVAQIIAFAQELQTLHKNYERLLGRGSLFGQLVTL